MSDLLTAALEYAIRGWYVFPVAPKSKKHPITTRGHHDATRDEAQIRAWWASTPHANIGVATKPSGLVVLDVDVADGKPGTASFAEMAHDLNDTLSATTGSGGRHLIYARTDAAQAQRKIRFRPGLDLLGDGYFVAPPSVHPSGGTYAWQTPLVAPAPLPAVLHAQFAGSSRHGAHVQPWTGGTHASPEVIESARQRLARHGPAIEGQGGDARTYQVGAILFRGYDLTFEEAWPLASEWNATCQPPWSEGDLVAKLRNGASYAQGEPGAERAAVAAAHAIAKLSAQFAASAVPPGPDGLRAVRLADAARRPKPPLRYYTSGLRGLDEATGGGLITRTLQVVLGPPGAGKTGFAVELSLAMAKQIPSLYLSTELETDEIAARHAAPLLGVPWTDLERGKVPMAQIEAVLESLDIWCIGSDLVPRGATEALDFFAQELSAIYGKCGVRPYGTIDYLQDLVPGSLENQRGMVGELATRCRTIAQGLDCPVTAVCSVGRQYYSASRERSLREGDDAVAYLGAAKESGGVDYAASTIMFLDVGVATDSTAEWRPARVAVAKARRGRAGFVGARFNGALGRWVYAPEAEVEMTQSGKAQARQDNQDTSDETAVLSKVRAEAALGQYRSMRQMREDHCPPGVSKHRTSAAISRLLSDGRLVYRDGVDSFNRSQQTLAIPATLPASLAAFKGGL